MTDDMPSPADEAAYQAHMQKVRETVLVAHRAVDQDRLPMWVLYGPGTADHPGFHVMRLWMTLPVARHTDVMVKATSLNELHSVLPPGLSKVVRSPGDDPNILETWL